MHYLKGFMKMLNTHLAITETPNFKLPIDFCNETDRLALAGFFELTIELPPPFVSFLNQVFSEPGLWELFKNGPSSRAGHHDYAGGNVAHAVEVAKLCLQIGQEQPDLVDRNVLLISALLHDIGKVYEYERINYRMEISAVGRMVGHKFTSFAIVWAALKVNHGLTPNQSLGIQNCMAACTGWDANFRGPACIEAEILSRADQMSACFDLHHLSHKRMEAVNGFGVRHKHARETPFHVKDRSPRELTRAEKLRKLCVPRRSYNK